jgi:hypothetical protein
MHTSESKEQFSNIDHEIDIFDKFLKNFLHLKRRRLVDVCQSRKENNFLKLHRKKNELSIVFFSE